MKNRLSRRLQSFDSSVFRNVFLHQQRLENPIDLSVGVPEDPLEESVKKRMQAAIEHNQTTYTPSNGLPELRKLLAKKLERNNISISNEQVTVVPGLTTGLLLVYLALLDAGDEIITIDPSYPPYNQIAEALGVTVQAINALPTFQLDLPAIDAAITDDTKAIIINSPNNPTGAVYPQKDLEKLAEIAAKNGVYIISDEIYEHFVYEGSHFSVGSIYADTISMYGFSKQFSMTGLRLGYIAGPSDVIDAINELQQYTVFSSSTIAQHAALEALNSNRNLVKKYSEKRDMVMNAMNEAGIELHGAHGAYYAFFKAPNNLTDLEFSEAALNNNLILVPGRAFTSRHGYMRLSYGVPKNTLREGLEKLKKTVELVK